MKRAGLEKIGVNAAPRPVPDVPVAEPGAPSSSASASADPSFQMTESFAPLSPLAEFIAFSMFIGEGIS